MPKLNEKKIRWIIKEREKGEIPVKNIAKIQNITPRRVRQLYNQYKETGKLPELKTPGRPPEKVSKQERRTIRKAYKKYRVNAHQPLERFYSTVKTLETEEVQEYIKRHGAEGAEELSEYFLPYGVPAEFTREIVGVAQGLGREERNSLLRQFSYQTVESCGITLHPELFHKSIRLIEESAEKAETAEEIMEAAKEGPSEYEVGKWSISHAGLPELEKKVEKLEEELFQT